MRIRILVLGCLGAACAYGQAHRFSWQDLCFKNPALPVCKGNDYAIKNPGPTKEAAPKSVVTSPFPSKPGTAKPSTIVVGGIDWRFADPFADALVEFNFSGLSASPLARSLITLMGTQQGLTEGDLKKIFDGLSDVDQVALSVRNNRIVAMIAGHVADSALPAPEAGLKAVPVSGGVLLFGHADAVDQAMQRIAMKGAPTELMRSLEQRQASSEFWAVGSAGLVGPQAVSAGLKQFALTVWVRDQLISAMAIEFNGAPNAKTLQMWQAKLGNGAIVEGNAVHVRVALEADQVRQKFGEITAGPLGQGLAALVQAGRYLPVRDTTVPKQTKPIIHGLDGGGLDSGPREVN